MNVRMLGPATAETVSVNGRSYVGTPGAVYDVQDGADSQSLGSSGWARIAWSGPTSARPTTAQTSGYWAALGTHFFDTTLAKLIVFDGATWRDPATGNAV